MGDYIDFDNPDTFPHELKIEREAFEKLVPTAFYSKNVESIQQLEHRLDDLHISEWQLVKDYVRNNTEAKVAVCHCTRILDESEFWKHGIVTGGGVNAIGEKRICKLLRSINLGEEAIQEILSHIHYLWNRDKNLRTESVHFFLNANQVYTDDVLNYYAINLGGEVLRWALEAIDKNLYKQEPYKQLWIKGTPSVVRFKCKLRDIHEVCRYSLIAEIVKYYILSELFGIVYEFKFTGMTLGAVPPENILAIDEIYGYTHMQEKYAEYKNFYNTSSSRFMF